jgi:uncharacterized protein HemY
MIVSPQDWQHLLAAEGWLELGDWLAANEELEEIEATCRAHPSVFALRVRIYCAAGKWEIALQIGEVIAKTYADAELHLVPMLERTSVQSQMFCRHSTIVGSGSGGRPLVAYRTYAYRLEEPI